MSLKSRFVFLAFASGLTFAGPPMGNDWTEIAVPKAIQTSQEIISCPNGWRVFDEANNVSPDKSQHKLRDVSVYDGHPREMASLIPDVDQEIKSKKLWISIWKLSPVSKSGFWIKCSYGGTRLDLCMPLPRTAREIRVTSSTEVPNNPVIVKVDYH